MNENQQFEKPITNEEIDEVSELELMDVLAREKKKESEKYQTEVRAELISLFENSYFDAMDQIDNFNESISDEDFKERFNFNIERLRDCVDKIIPVLVEKVNALSKKRKINIISENSLRDVLSNALFNGLSTVLWFKKNINSKNKKIIEKIENPDSGRRKALDNTSKLLDLNGLDYYFKELCLNEDRLKKEAGFEYGYISKFSDFFRDTKYGKNYPSGSKKLPYFRFFSELDKLKDKNKKEIDISKFDFEEELEKLDDEFVDKDEIRKDFFKKEE